ncbi:hypothetical protein [Sneathiella glossodoripedis]|uniref:hypothetical protein n=1 Tax=Sneathiella glossodoripedis TaxID=418853 RepID=UPI00047107B7|nr:hypothetical protein [Sneathiella glossodoripedis]
MNRKFREGLQRQAEIANMTNDQKGFYLLNAVRQLSFQGGDPEEELIWMLVDRGGILQGILAAAQLENEGTLQ